VIALSKANLHWEATLRDKLLAQRKTIGKWKWNGMEMRQHQFVVSRLPLDNPSFKTSFHPMRSHPMDCSPLDLDPEEEECLKSYHPNH